MSDFEAIKLLMELGRLIFQGISAVVAVIALHAKKSGQNK